MLILRLKQCERALADGRLDEAFDLARQPDVRAHRRGQQLTTKLLKSLIDRGRRHLAQGRLAAAAADADKAVLLGGNLPDGVQLQEAVRTARRGHENVNQQAAQALALARRHAEPARGLKSNQRHPSQRPMLPRRSAGIRRRCLWCQPVRLPSMLLRRWIGAGAKIHSAVAELMLVAFRPIRGLRLLRRWQPQTEGIPMALLGMRMN